ncbi:inner nuclear membrane protein enriched at telomere/subtelomere region [Basidiobolus ranarum]|uniref:Inner nuclear membrane protein enriched at telomere/subtelomere region n=1 Tax=Basidiobolus ranarum TaxID=34480 RepID=A0ABR2WQH4_9FUNG
MDDLSYLDPNFDPNSVRVVDLRRILLKHEIPFNANSKKATLIDLFDTYITPNAAQWLEDATNVKPSNRGMIFVGFDKDPERTSPSPVRPRSKARGRVRSTVEKFELLSSDGELSPPPRSSTVRRKIKTKSPTEKSNTLNSDGESSLHPRGHVNSRTPSVDDAGFSSDDFSPLPNSYSVAEIGTPEPELEAQTLSRSNQLSEAQDIVDPGVFSDENPFQSGGETPDRRKKTKVKTKKLHKSEPQLESSELPPSDNAHPISTPEDIPQVVVNQQAPSATSSSGPRKFMSPSFSRVNLKPEIKVESEEAVVKPRRRTRRRRHHQQEAKVEYDWKSFWIFLTVILAAYLFWIRQKSLALGYCEQDELASSKSIFYPKCTPCPLHAICRDHKFVSCDRNYMMKGNPLISLINPLQIKCIPDKLTLAKVDSTVELAKEILSERAGKAECDANANIHAKVSEIELKRLIETNPSAHSVEIEEIWPSVFRELTEQRQHIKILSDGNSKQLYFLSREPKYPIQCRLRKGLYSLLLGNLKQIGGGLLLIMAGVYSFTRYNSHSSEKKLVRDLVQQVLIRLAEQESLHYADPVQHSLSAVSVVQLRDVLLRSMHNHVQRKHIWEKVRKVVETNSNVRSGVTEIRGEPHRVWEWVGTSISPAASFNHGDSLYPKLNEEQGFMSDEGMFSDD